MIHLEVDKSETTVLLSFHCNKIMLIFKKTTAKINFGDGLVMQIGKNWVSNEQFIYLYIEERILTKKRFADYPQNSSVCLFVCSRVRIKI